MNEAILQFAVTARWMSHWRCTALHLVSQEGIQALPYRSRFRVQCYLQVSRNKLLTVVGRVCVQFQCLLLLLTSRDSIGLEIFSARAPHLKITLNYWSTEKIMFCAQFEERSDLISSLVLLPSCMSSRPLRPLDKLL